jgi:hypothetical protein
MMTQVTQRDSTHNSTRQTRARTSQSAALHGLQNIVVIIQQEYRLRQTRSQTNADPQQVGARTASASPSFFLRSFAFSVRLSRNEFNTRTGCDDQCTRSPRDATQQPIRTVELTQHVASRDDVVSLAQQQHDDAAGVVEAFEIVERVAGVRYRGRDHSHTSHARTCSQCTVPSGGSCTTSFATAASKSLRPCARVMLAHAHCQPCVSHRPTTLQTR